MNHFNLNKIIGFILFFFLLIFSWSFRFFPKKEEIYDRSKEPWRTPYVYLPKNSSVSEYEKLIRQVDHVYENNYVRLIFPINYEFNHEVVAKSISELLRDPKKELLIFDISELGDNYKEVFSYWIDSVSAINSKIFIGVGASISSVHITKVKNIMEDIKFISKLKGLYFHSASRDFYNQGILNKFLKKNKDLLLLNIENGSVGLNTDADINGLMDLIKTEKNLRSLTIANNWLSVNENYMKSVAKMFLDLKNLEYLNVSKNGLGLPKNKKLVLSFINNLGTLKKLKSLNLGSSWLGDTKDNYIPTLSKTFAKLTQLNRLNLTDNLLHQSSLNATDGLVKAINKLSSLTLFDIKSNRDFNCSEKFPALKKEKICID